jgi:hypothetical protein
MSLQHFVLRRRSNLLLFQRRRVSISRSAAKTARCLQRPTIHRRWPVFAHLHFEMREVDTPFIGPGYREDTGGWLDPMKFIEAHRGAPDDDVGRGRTN